MTGRFCNSIYSTVMTLCGKQIGPVESESLINHLQVIFEGNASKVIWYLEEREDTNMCDTNKLTALQQAVENVMQKND